jgi:hypothetical protein
MMTCLLLFTYSERYNFESCGLFFGPVRTKGLIIQVVWPFHLPLTRSILFSGTFTIGREIQVRVSTHAVGRIRDIT